MKLIDQSYNLATDCLDKHAASLDNKHKKALITATQDPQSGKIYYQDFSYSTLTGLSNRLAHSLSQLQFPQGSRVILRLENQVEFVLSFIALIKAGLIPVPTSTQLTGEELKFLIQDSQAVTLISSLEKIPESFHFAESLKEFSHLKKLILLSPKNQKLPQQSLRWQDLLKKGQTNFKTLNTQAQDPAYWLYTSGTTANPKAVIHSHASIPAHDERAKAWQEMRLGDVIFNTSALNWSYALTAGLLDVWRHGLTSVIYHGKPSP
ncbi:MAG: acyl-CoA synthetase, partial [Deltaproteobacteria bacterium]|nr:acyl-CoA synthetase [Deltaproteobacteria bacterium]